MTPSPSKAKDAAPEPSTPFTLHRHLPLLSRKTPVSGSDTLDEEREGEIRIESIDPYIDKSPQDFSMKQNEGEAPDVNDSKGKKVSKRR